jgi:hypothetical protein
MGLFATLGPEQSGKILDHTDREYPWSAYFALAARLGAAQLVDANEKVSGVELVAG